MNSRREFFSTFYFVLALATASTVVFKENGNVSIIYDIHNKGTSEVPGPFEITKLSDDIDKPFEYKYYIGKREEGS